MLSVSINKKLENFPLEVSFEVKNEIAVLVGPSGSGKTTILNCIAGITKPDSGIIQLENDIYYQIDKKPLAIQQRHVGYLFQDYALFPHMTVYRNIIYGSKDDSAIEKLMEIVGINHLLDRYPNQISGGEKQRVALVRALATRPRILLLDEPFSALDENTRKECQDELLRLHRMWNIPIVMVTHDLSEANKMGDTVMKIEKGKLKVLEEDF